MQLGRPGVISNVFRMPFEGTFLIKVLVFCLRSPHRLQPGAKLRSGPESLRKPPLRGWRVIAQNRCFE